MSRLSIRLRLTIVFAVAMAMVLIALGAFLYFRLAAGLDRTLDTGLRSRAADVTSLLQSGAVLSSAKGIDSVTDDSFTQILDAEGNVLGTSRGFGDEPVLTDRQLDRALAAPLLIDARPPPAFPDQDERIRLLAQPARAVGAQLVVAVGTSLEERDDALNSLLAQLLVISPIALLITSALGYFVALAALRPVDAMRRRAATISAREPGARLPVSGPRDEVARLGDTLNAMLERLEAAFANERRFIADASHELRTPLALLKTELELAQNSARTREELEDAISSAAEETDRLTQLSEDLLLLARSDDDALALREADLSADVLLSRIAERFERRAENQQRSIEVEADAGTEFRGDELRLEQALGNLVDNALRHGAGTITLKAARQEERIELHVIDEGTGFPDGFVEQAFDRFSQADAARSDAGSGLGLAIVDVIARAHGGRAHIAAGSIPDVWLALPAVASLT